MPRQVVKLGPHELATARRNSVKRHAVWRIDGRSRHRTTHKDITELCSPPLFLGFSPHYISSVDIFLCLPMCPGIPQSLVCVRVLIPLRKALLHSAFPCIRSFQSPTPHFVCFMRAPSFLLALLLVVGQICKLISFDHAYHQHTDQRWCYSVPDVSVSLGFRRDV